ncbi:two-component system, OmpR family, sensor histidine kinase CpxA [Desulfocicer vacuolatum DSM 3385]|uniref:histidine kinase n=1 Tax=Desulfocicer vacuolatum DSM 3385 TaxID=1121400 RepID=A0A1W2DGR5_9BACT|nr:ATP-binding protein [Desulfocicer vacuolatum]SMC96689.1 two-component system, OmpR family, sensor histidine kinase CpxA [Desulfocicer vacuolatum DSM 3385]
MNKLFLKLFFIWYCFSIFFATIVTSTVIILLNTDSKNSVLTGVSSKALYLFGQVAVEHYEAQRKSALDAMLRDSEKENEVQISLYNEEGEKLGGNTSLDTVSPIIKAALAEGEFINIIYFWKPVMARRISGTEGNRYVVIFEPGIFIHSDILSKNFFLRLFIILFAGGVISFFLTRHLVSPIKKIQQATLRIARGDFSVRIGNQFHGRRDELVDLARDFDNMAEKIDRLKTIQTQVLRDISHELRSPLTRLGVALELECRRAGTNNGLFLDRIRLEAERLNALIDQILVVAGFKQDIETMKIEPINLKALLKRIVVDADFETQSQNSPVAVIHAREIVYHGNIDLLKRTFDNIIRNAVLYSKTELPIDISILTEKKEGQSYVVVMVSDHGDGVPENSLEKIFHPFYRVENARDRKSGGTGLGLAISDRAVKMHNGFILASNRAGGGLTVKTYLPFQPHHRPIPEPLPLRAI